MLGVADDVTTTAPNTTRPLDTLAAPNARTPPPKQTQKALDTLAAPNARTPPPKQTQKALGTLAVAERDTLASLG
jgi:hypothetical protein